VCWADTPKGWVDCGMAAALSQVGYAKAISDQVINVASLALNVATMGGGGKVAGVEGKTGIRLAFKSCRGRLNQ
jgi:hypothetical protein